MDIADLLSDDLNNNENDLLDNDITLNLKSSPYIALGDLSAKQSNEISIIHVNVQNITTLHKLDKIEMLMTQHSSDVISFTETYLTNSNQSLYKFNNYNEYHKPRRTYGGEISCYVNSKHVSSRIETPVLTNETIGEFLGHFGWKVLMYTHSI